MEEEENYTNVEDGYLHIQGAGVLLFMWGLISGIGACLIIEVVTDALLTLSIV